MINRRGPSSGAGLFNWFLAPLLTVAMAGCSSSSNPSSASPVPFDTWTDVPFSVDNFSTNSAGSITPTTVPYVYRYSMGGHTMLFQGSAQILVNNDTTNEIRFAIPGGHTARPYDPISGNDGAQARTGAVWNGGGTAGLAIAVIDTLHNVISVQRWDGVAAAAFPQTTCFVGFSITVPVE